MPPDYRNHNIYHVVEALLEESTAAELQEAWFRPQTVRNAQLHSGEFRSFEFVERMMMSSYQDPTFDQAHTRLWLITQASIIQWLKLGGQLTLKPIHNRSRQRRRVKWAPFLIPITFTAVGIAAGVAIGKFLLGE